MQAPEQIDDIYSLRAKVTAQQSLIKQLKKSGNDTTAENNVLADLRSKLGAVEAAVMSTQNVFNRKSFDELILRKMYVVPSFEIHNGPAGLFDVSYSFLLSYI